MSNNGSLLLTSARLLDGNCVDILILDGKIARVEPSGSINDFDGEVLDVRNNLLAPGFVDLHTHLREPGREDSETIATGCAAAVSGGFTAISAMANTSPVADSAGVVELVKSRSQKVGLCEVFPIGAVTKGLEGQELSEMGAMANSLAQVRIFSDDGKCVSNSRVMRRALEYVKSFDGIIAQHAQDPELTIGALMNESELSGRLGVTGWPRVAEEAIIARDVLLAEHVGARLHVCHLSTAGAVEIVRQAKERGVAVTAEVTPHHLMLTEEWLADYNPLYKVNPPLRTRADVEAVRKGLAEGVIDIVATDHAPHPIEDKECELSEAAFGMIGLETALGITAASMIDSGLIGWPEVIDRLSISPARIGGYIEHGQEIKVGAFANLAVIDTEYEGIFSRAEIFSKSSNSPFIDFKVRGRVEQTIFNGKIVFNRSGGGVL